MSTAIIDKVYKHFKNGERYRVLHLATHAEMDGMDLVVYRNEASGKVYARSRLGFEEKVGSVDRFTLVEDAP